MTLPPVPLNKLIVLREILRQASVSAAGRALGRAQPSVTAVLQDLRVHYGDRLLVRQGNRMVPTPFASEVLTRLDAWHAETMELVDLRGTFDPASATRDFKIRVSDYQLAILAPMVVAALAEGPGLTATFLPPSSDLVSDMATLGIDLAAHSGGRMPDGLDHGRCHADRFVVFYDPACTAPPTTVDAFCEAGFVLAAPTGRGSGPVDTWLAERGRTRQVRYRTRQILGAARLIKGAPLLTVLPLGLAADARGLGLAHAPLPFEVPPIETSLAWPRRLRGDAGHRWLRDALLAPVCDADASAPLTAGG